MRFLAGEVLCGEHKVVGEIEGVDDGFGGIDGLVQQGAVFAVGLHGVGVVKEDGNQIAVFVFLSFGGNEWLCEGEHKRGDAQYAQRQYHQLLDGLLPFGLLLDVLQHLDIGEIHGLVPSEVEQMDDDRNEDGKKAEEKKRISEGHNQIL